MAKKHSALTNDDLHNPRGILVHSTGSMLVMSQSMSTATASFHFIPDATDTYTLGNAARAWKELFVSTSSIKFADKAGNVIQTLTATAEGVSFVSSSGEVADVSGSTISGSKLHIVGDTFIGGDLTLGDAASDSISISADLTSNLTPNADATYDLGSSSQGWNDLHLGSGGVINLDGGDVTLTHAAGKITLGGDGAVEFDFADHEMTNVDIDGGAIDGTTIGGASAAAGTFLGIVGTTLSATGDVDLGNATSDTITATGRFDSDIVPSTDSARDLGTSALQFAEAHIDTGYIDSLTVNGATVAITDTGGDGTLDGVIIGGTTAAAGTFTTLNTTGLTAIGDASGDTLTINAATINPANIAAGTDNTVVVYNGSTLLTDEIDSRVWGTTLVDTDGSGANNELATWSDADSLIGEGNLTFDGSTLVVTGDISSSAATTASFGRVVTSGSIETSASLFIAKDRAISFDNGDVTLTHSSNLLDIDGGNTRVDRLEIDSAADYIDVDTNLQIIAAADIHLDPGGGEVDVDGNLIPNTDSADDLGASGKAWNKLWVDDIDLNAQGSISIGGTGRIDLDGDDDTSIRASADDVITFEAAGADQVAIADGTFTPSTSDDISLGTTSLQFSDLFLGEGGVINWDNGDFTATQANNLLTFTGGNTRVDRLEIDSANDYVDVDTDLKIVATADITLDPGGNNVKPGGDSQDSLGVAGTAWANLYVDAIDLDGQGRIDLDDDQDTSIRASGDDIITFEAAGSDQVAFTDGTIEPSTNDDIALGTTSKMFSDLFLGTGGVVNWNNGNATITHAAGSLTVQGADLYLSGSLYVSGSQTFINSTDLNITDKTITIASGSTTSAQINGAGFNFGGAGEDDQTAVGTLRYVHSETALSSSFELISKGLRSVSTVSPFASDGAALGTTALMWSDLFLANAGVINFNNGNMTVTHTAGDLAVGGGTLTVDGGVKVDNFTLDGTELDLSSGDFTVDVAGDVNIDADGGDVTITDDGAHILHINATTISGSATSSGSFAHIAVNSVSASRIDFTQIDGAWTNAGNTVADLGSITTVDINGGTINGITDLAVADGGTGASTLTDGGVLLGSGTSAITATAVLANGELLIGDNSTDPTVATLTGTSNQITVTNGGGSITLSAPQSIDTSADVTFDSLTLDDLTAGRVVFSGADGLLSDDSDFTFATDTLTATKIGAFEAAGAIDFSDENMTNVDIDSGDIGAVTISAGLTWSAAQDLNSQNLTNVDIDSGTVDGATIGAASHTTIKGTTIDATTDFTIDGLVLTADTITNDSNLTMDLAGDLAIDVDGGDVTITDDGVNIATINATKVSGSLSATGSFGQLQMPTGSANEVPYSFVNHTAVVDGFNQTGFFMSSSLLATVWENSIGVALSGSEEFQFAPGGTFHADADIVAFSSTVASDMNLKENIETTKYGLDDVMKLRGVDFDWKREDMGHSVGVLAQEVEAIIPEVVKEHRGLKGKGNFKAVDYNKLVPVLIESIKELKKEIDDLKSN